MDGWPRQLDKDDLLSIFFPETAADMYDQSVSESTAASLAHHHKQHVTQEHQQHSPQQAGQHSNHGFMSDPNCWLGDDVQGELTPRAAQRRAKRSIPETEKDEKYWEKRKRNNMAAKKSRENKRVLENDIKHKVTHLEEQNALLRKEITIIKSRFGLALNQSILTPEERAQCMLELKTVPETIEATHRRDSSTDDVSSTSPTLHPATVGHATDEDDGNPRKSSDSFVSDLRMKHETHTAPTYGPSAYGPFNPSPSWAPALSSSFQPLYGNTQAQSYPPHATQGKLSTTYNTVQDKISSPYDHYANNGMNLIRSPYNYYSQYASRESQVSYLGGNNESSADVVPADLSMSRSKALKEPKGGECLNITSGTLRGLSSSVAQPSSNSLEPQLNLGDTSVKMLSLGQVSRTSDNSCRGLRLPTRVMPSSYAGSNPTDVGTVKDFSQEHLRRENDALKMTVRTLSAQVEHLRDKVQPN